MLMPHDPAAVGLPNLVVIGAMKCGTTALHRCLAGHPEIAMAAPKELNFFVGTCDGESPAADSWHAGNWHRGVDWYRGWFCPDAAVRGEVSPAYTSPSFPDAAERMAAIIPDARLVYLVRDPIDRALSQYRHHRREGTESRSLRVALLDDRSQYLARSRFYQRLTPYLRRFPPERILVVLQEDLLSAPVSTMASLYRFLGVDDAVARLRRPAATGASQESLDGVLERRLRAQLADDVAALRAFLGRDLGEWRPY